MNINESSQVSEARRTALQLADQLGFNATASGKLAIIVTEAATNLLKHAHSGEIHLGICSHNGADGVEMLSIDRGPGMARIDDCLKDGYSTHGSAGTGLGAIARLSDEFDVYSQLGKGTCLVARMYSTEPALSSAIRQGMTVGTVQVPFHGETECGDSWGVRQEPERMVFMLADGLGHGTNAAEASRTAVSVLRTTSEPAPLALLEQTHQALRATRGAAVAIASIELENRKVRFAGIGNISSMILTASAVQHLISHNGTVGHNVRKFQEFTYSWPADALLLMHSDGITTNWRLDAYPSLIRRHPSLLAAVLFRDSSRGRDDACVVAARAVR